MHFRGSVKVQFKYGMGAVRVRCGYGTSAVWFVNYLLAPTVVEFSSLILIVLPANHNYIIGGLVSWNKHKIIMQIHVTQVV